MKIDHRTANGDGLVALNKHAKGLSDIQSSELNEQPADFPAGHHHEGIAGHSRHEFTKRLAGSRYGDAPFNRAEAFLREGALAQDALQVQLQEPGIDMDLGGAVRSIKRAVEFDAAVGNPERDRLEFQHAVV